MSDLELKLGRHIEAKINDAYNVGVLDGIAAESKVLSKNEIYANLSDKNRG